MNEEQFLITKIAQQCQGNQCRQTAIFEIKEKSKDYRGNLEEKVSWFCKNHFNKKIMKLGWSNE